MSTFTGDHGNAITEHQQEKPALSDASPSSQHSTVGPLDPSLLNEALFPPDSYTSDGVYWADLPRKERTRFIMNQNNAEAKKEAKWVWNMFKHDPMEPFRVYWNTYALVGMGLFVEGTLHRHRPRRVRFFPPADHDSLFSFSHTLSLPSPAQATSSSPSVRASYAFASSETTTNSSFPCLYSPFPPCGSSGNLSALYSAAWPTCFKTYAVCDERESTLPSTFPHLPVRRN